MLLICVSLLLAGCGNGKTENASFDSFMDDELSGLLESGALFSYEIEKTETGTTQTVYIWKNLLRRLLRLDLIKIYDCIPNEDEVVTLENGEGLMLNGNKLDFNATSDLSGALLRAILPKSSNVNAKTLRSKLQEMIIRLETLEYLGDTEIIAIKTTATGALLLENSKEGDMHLVFDLNELP